MALLHLCDNLLSEHFQKDFYGRESKQRRQLIFGSRGIGKMSAFHFIQVEPIQNETSPPVANIHTPDNELGILPFKLAIIEGLITI